MVKFEWRNIILARPKHFTKAGHSYIRNENQNQFEYYVSEDDLEYWVRYKSHGFEVL